MSVSRSSDLGRLNRIVVMRRLPQRDGSLVLRAFIDSSRKILLKLIPSEGEVKLRKDGDVFVAYVPSDVFETAKRSDVTMYLSRDGYGAVMIGDCRLDLSALLVDLFRCFGCDEVSGAELVMEHGELELRVPVRGGRLFRMRFVSGTEEELLVLTLLKEFMSRNWCFGGVHDGWGDIVCRLNDFFGRSLEFNVRFEVCTRSATEISGVYVSSNVEEVIDRVDEEGEEVWDEVYGVLQKALLEFEKWARKLERVSNTGSYYIDAMLAAR